MTTNIVSEYIKDPVLFRPIPRIRSSTIFVDFSYTFDRASQLHLLYGFSSCLPSLVYYFMLRSRGITSEIYYTEESKRINNFLLSEPTQRKHVLSAVGVWLLLECLSLITLSIMFRLHASYLSPNEPAIVTLDQTEKRPIHEDTIHDQRQGSSPPTHNHLMYGLFVCPPWRRIRHILRMLLHLLIFLSLVCFCVSMALKYFGHRMKNGQILMDWFARAYLEPDTSFTVEGMWWNFFFWYREVFWAYDMNYSRTGREFAFSVDNRPLVW